MTINCTVFYVHLIIQLFIYLVLLTNKLQSRNQTDWWANVCMCVQSSHKNANINLSVTFKYGDTTRENKHKIPLHHYISRNCNILRENDRCLKFHLIIQEVAQETKIMYLIMILWENKKFDSIY